MTSEAIVVKVSSLNNLTTKAARRTKTRTPIQQTPPAAAKRKRKVTFKTTRYLLFLFFGSISDVSFSTGQHFLLTMRRPKISEKYYYWWLQ
jgi:hypothetical protein